jgi:hypothetical protein
MQFPDWHGTVTTLRRDSCGTTSSKQRGVSPPGRVNQALVTCRDRSRRVSEEREGARAQANTGGIVGSREGSGRGAYEGSGGGAVGRRGE